MYAGFIFSIQKSIKKNILELKADKSWNLSRSIMIQMQLVPKCTFPHNWNKSIVFDSPSVCDKQYSGERRRASLLKICTQAYVIHMQVGIENGLYRCTGSGTIHNYTSGFLGHTHVHSLHHFWNLPVSVNRVWNLPKKINFILRKYFCRSFQKYISGRLSKRSALVQKLLINNRKI